MFILRLLLVLWLKTYEDLLVTESDTRQALDRMPPQWYLRVSRAMSRLRLKIIGGAVFSPDALVNFLS